MSQLSKTAGSLLAVMTNEVSEDVLISKMSIFISLIRGQANKKIVECRRTNTNADRLPDYVMAYEKLGKSADSVQRVSKLRDRSIASTNYAAHMSTMLYELSSVLEIAVQFDWIDFEDNTRFGGYLEEK